MPLLYIFIIYIFVFFRLPPSPASTEPSQAELSGDEGEDKKKRKKRGKKLKGHNTDTRKDTQDITEHQEDTDTEPVDAQFTVDSGVTNPAVEDPGVPSSELPPGNDAVLEKVASPLPLPQLSKWERDEEGRED